MIKNVFLGLFSTCLTTFAMAQVTDTIPHQETSKFSIGGYINTYYDYNFNNPNNKDNFGSTGSGRAFYGRHNEFALGVVQTKMEYTTKDVHIVADLIYGPSAQYINYGNRGISQIIKQAYIEKQFTPKLAVTIGQFGTHIGYELIDAPENIHHNHTVAFGNNPFYHMGIKADYAISEKVGFMAGLVNGWDQISDNNQAKTIISQLSFAPKDGFEIYLNWIGGNETSIPKIPSFTQLFDLTSSYDINDRLSLGINGSFGSHKIGKDSINTNWGGGVLYTSYQLMDFWTIGLRGEIFDDTQKARNINSYYQGITFTNIFALSNGTILIKPEFRLDNSSRKIYYKGLNNDLINSQSTVGVAIIGKF